MSYNYVQFVFPSSPLNIITRKQSLRPTYIFLSVIPPREKNGNVAVAEIPLVAAGPCASAESLVLNLLTLETGELRQRRVSFCLQLRVAAEMLSFCGAPAVRETYLFMFLIDW